MNIGDNNIKGDRKEREISQAKVDENITSEYGFDYEFHNKLKKELDDIFKCTFDDLHILRNKDRYKNELDTRVLLHDRISPRDLELLYLSIIEDNKKHIERLEQMVELQREFIDKLQTTLCGDNNR